MGWTKWWREEQEAAYVRYLNEKRSKVRREVQG